MYAAFGDGRNFAMFPAGGSTDPDVIPTVGFLYSKKVMGVTQLFYRSDDGTVHTITPLPAAATVFSVFGRQGDVVAADNDYSASQIYNDSIAAGDTVANAMGGLAQDLGATNLAISNLTSTSIANSSTVTGTKVTNALNTLKTTTDTNTTNIATNTSNIASNTAAIAALSSTSISNSSSVTGTTVTAALNTLKTAVDTNTSALSSLNSSSVSNSSSVTGTTVTAALNTLKTAVDTNTTALAAKAPAVWTTRTVTAATDTLLSTDNNIVIRGNRATQITFTVPQNTVPAGATVGFFQEGAGKLTVSAGTGVSIISEGGLLSTSGTTNSYASLLFITQNLALFVGSRGA